MEAQSKLKIFSLGIVVKDKPSDSNIITVYPVEHISLVEGGLSQQEETISTTTDNISRDSVQIEAKKDTNITAKWISLGGGNQVTPPDVYANETVLLFRYEDTGEYYWTTIFVEPDLRRLEHVTYAYSNEREYGKRVGKDNSYWLTVSTRDKYIHLHTSDNDGEATQYDFKIDTKKGIVYLKDKVGNYIQLESNKSLLTCNIKEKTVIQCPVIETHGNEVIINAKSSVTINTNNATVNTSTAAVNATSSATIVSPTITLDGNTTITGNMVVNGTSNLKGAVTMVNGKATVGASGMAVSGDVSINGSANISGNMNAGNCGCPNL